MKIRSSSKLINFFWIVSTLTIAGIAIAISIALNIVGLGWTWSLVGILMGIAVFFVSGKVSANDNLLSVLESIFPVIGKFKANQQKMYEYRAVIDKVEYALEYHKLTQQLKEKWRDKNSDDHYSFNSDFHERVIKGMMEEKNQTKVTERCIEIVTEEMERKHSEEVLELLYRESHGYETGRLYDNIKNSDPKLEELAEILKLGGHLPHQVELPDIGETDKIERGFLPSATVEFPYTTEDIKAILKNQQNFKLTQVVEEIKRLEKVWSVASAYLAFLIKNKILNQDYNIEVSNIVQPKGAKSPGLLLGRKFSDMLTEGERNTLNALLQEGETAFKSSAVNIPSTAERESLILTALAMFFTEDRLDCPNLKAAVCKLASKQPIAKQQHLAYLEYREDLRQMTSLDDLPFVSVKYIADNWKNTIKGLGTSPRFKKEMDAIQENLAEGNWWTRLPPLIEEVLDRLGKELKGEIRSIKKVIGKYPPMEDVLRRIFRGLKLETIERLLETRTTIAYLFTFDGLEGSLAELIDCLSFFKGGKNRAILQDQGIVTFQCAGREKYIFTDYIAHCRLGIVPIGMSFDEFFMEFEKDLTTVYENRGLLHLKNSEINDFEMIIHRFGLLGRDRHGFDKFNPKAQRTHALPKIQELFATSLIPEDIITLICYEQSPNTKNKIDIEPIVDGILSLGTIRDFMGDEVEGLSKSRSDILTDNDQALKIALIKKMECETLHGLARLLLASDETKKAAGSRLAKLIQKLPEFEDIPQICRLIAANYTDLLVDIAKLYRK